MNREQLFAKLAKITNLPTLPAVMDRLTKAVRDPNSDSEQIARIIKDDPSMMARVLKVVNSAAYRGGGEAITSVQQAVARMGLRGVENIALSTSVFSTYGKTGEKDFNREDFWRHSICVGFVANVLYNHTREALSHRYSPDIMHLTGLFHDIGKIVFEHFFHADFLRALALCAEKQLPLFKAEAEIFGADHAEVGAWLSTRWNVPREVSEAIRWHHEPESAEAEFLDLVRLSHTANYICNIEKIGSGGDLMAPIFIIGVWKRLGLKVRDIRDVVKEAVEESKHSETLLAFMRA